MKREIAAAAFGWRRRIARMGMRLERNSENELGLGRNEAGAFAAVEEEAGGEIAAAVEEGFFNDESGGFDLPSKRDVVKEVEAGRDLAKPAVV